MSYTDNINSLYDYLSAKKINNLGTREEFTEKMKNQEKRSALHGYMYDNRMTPITLPEFNTSMGFSVDAELEKAAAREGQPSGSSVSAQYPVLPGIQMEGNASRKVPDSNFPNTNTYVEGFGAGFEQGVTGLAEGSKIFVANAANLFTGSSNDAGIALELLNQYEKDGVDIKGLSARKMRSMQLKKDYEDAVSKYEKDMDGWYKKHPSLMDRAKGMLPFWGDMPEKPKNPFEQVPVLGNISDAFSYRDYAPYKLIEEALKSDNPRAFLEEKMKNKTWGDTVQEDAMRKLATLKPTKGFGAWVGNLAPQMIPNAIAIAAAVHPSTRAFSRPIGMIGMSGLSTSSAGMAIADARNYASEKEINVPESDILHAGLLAFSIELGTEMIPFNRYMGTAGNLLRKKISGDVTREMVNSPAARKEAEKFFRSAAKNVPGLISKETLKRYGTDVLTEGLSEFSAESLGAMVPMLYANSEDYPSLVGILQNGMEGAKGGLFMGAFLGGGSSLVGNYAQNQRRKQQGNITLADTGSGIVEIIGGNGDGYSALNKEGEVINVRADEIKESHTVKWDDFGRYASAVRKDRAASSVLSDLQAGEKRILEENFLQAEKNFDRLWANSGFSLDRETVLRSTKEEQERILRDVAGSDNLSSEQKDAALEYVARGNIYNSYAQYFAEKIDDLVQDVSEEVSAVINPEMNAAVSAIISGKQRQITGGNIVRLEDGSVDRESSDRQVYYLDDEGKRQVASIDLVERVLESVPAEEALRQAGEFAAGRVIAQQENEEVRPYKEGEKVRLNNGLTGKIAGINEDGTYLFSFPTPDAGIQTMNIEPRQILDNLTGIDTGSIVDYRDGSGNIASGEVDNASRFGSGVIFIDGEEIPVADVIGLHREESEFAGMTNEQLQQSIGDIDVSLNSGVLNEQQIQEFITQKEKIQKELEMRAKAGNANKTSANAVENEGIAPESNDNLPNPVAEIIARAPKQKNGEVDYDVLLEQSPEDFAALYESEEGAEETRNELASISENLSKKIQSEQKKLENATSINKKKDARKAIAELERRKKRIDGLVEKRYKVRKAEKNNPEASNTSGLKNDALSNSVISAKNGTQRGQYQIPRGDKGNEKTVKTKDKPKKITPHQKSLAKFNLEELGLREKILYDIASHAKFKWDDITNESGTVLSRGLKNSIFASSTNLNSERKKYFNILSNNGLTPEQYAHQLWEENPEGMSDMDILNEVNDVLLSVSSRGMALEALEKPLKEMEEYQRGMQENYEADNPVEQKSEQPEAMPLTPAQKKIAEEQTQEYDQKIEAAKNALDKAVAGRKREFGKFNSANSMFREETEQRNAFGDAGMTDVSDANAQRIREKYNSAVQQAKETYDVLRNGRADAVAKIEEEARRQTEISPEEKSTREMLDEVDGDIIKLVENEAKKAEIQQAEDFAKTDNTVPFRIDNSNLEVVNERFNEELQQQIDGTLPKGYTYKIGKPSDVLQSAGIPNLPIELQATRLSDKSMQENHPFDLSEIKDLPKAIQNPLAVFDSATKDGSFVILTGIEHNDKNFVVAIEANRKKGSIEINDIRSIHYRTSNVHIANWINNNLTRRADKQKMSEWFSKQRYNSAEVKGAFTRAAKVIQNFENLKLPGEKLQSSGQKMQSIPSKAWRKLIEWLQKTGLARNVFIDESSMRDYLKENYGQWMLGSELPPHLRKMATTKGEVYGFVTPEGDVYLDPKRMNANTPIHEFGHLFWSSAMPAEMKAKITGLLKQTQGWKRLSDNPAYAHLKTDDQKADELFNTLLGNYGEHNRQVQEITGDNISLFSRIQNAINEFLQWLKANVFGNTDAKLNEFAKRTLGELLGGKEISASRSRKNDTTNRTQSETAYASKSDYDFDVSGITAANAQEMKALKTESQKNGTFMKAPNGKKSNLNEQQWLQVRTKAFKKWFGDWENNPDNASKVVDENGEPLKVYHGTRDEFTVFDRKKTGITGDWGFSGKGFYFSPNKSQASGYGRRQYEVFLNMRHPFDFSNYSSKEEIAEELDMDSDGFKYISHDEIGRSGIRNQGAKLYVSNAGSRQFNSRMYSGGYDGTVNKSLGETVVFNPNQIKSATSNNGNFDENSDDIRFQFIGEQGAKNLDKAEEATARMDNLNVAREMETAFAEKGKRIEKLRESRPIEITGEEITPSEDLREYRTNAKKYGKDNLRGTYTNKSNGVPVEVVGSSIDEVVSHNLSKEQLQSVVAIPNIIEDSIYIDTLPNEDTKRPDIKSYDYYVVGLKIGGVDYTVKAVIANTEKGRYYDHSLTQIEKGKLLDELHQGAVPYASSGLSSTGESGEAKQSRPATIERETTINSPVSDYKDKRLLSILQTNEQENSRRIKMATGWERGADGKWRYEIPDIEIKHDIIEDIDDPDNTEGYGYILSDGGGKLGDFVYAEELFAAYPQLKNITVLYDDYLDASAEYSPKEKTIKLGDDFDKRSDSFQSVLIHEIQHAIQDIEGFAYGSNQGQFTDPTALSLAYKDFDANVKKLSGDKYENIGHVLHDERFSGYRDVFAKDVSTGQSLLDGMRNMYEDMDEDVFMANYEDFVKSGQKGTAYQQYFKTAGEVEARNASSRSWMTPEERHASLASETEDVAREDQIFIYDSLGANMAESSNEAPERNADENIMDYINRVAEWSRNNLENQKNGGTFAGNNNQIYGSHDRNRSSGSARREENSVSDGSSQTQQRGGDSLSKQAREVKNRLEEGIRAAEMERSEPLSIQEKEDFEKWEAYNYAQDNALWIDDLYSLGEHPLQGGNENTLVANEKEGVVYKSNNLINNSRSISKLLRATEIHNQLFPETKYELVGFTGFSNGLSRAPWVEVVLKQAYVDNVEQATPEEIADFMKYRGFEQVNEHTFSNGQYTVSDLRPRNVLKNAAGNIFVVDDIVTENDVQTKESGKEREIRFQVIPPGNPTPQLETTPDNDATPPVYREGESILDYAKRVSDWWKTSKPEQSATEKALNDAVLSIAELKVQRNRLNSKISGLKKTSGNRAQRIAEIKEHVGEARKYIHENLSKDMVEWMGATEFNAFISDMDKATSTRDMERILMHIDRTINNVALRKYGTVLKKLLNLKVSDKNDRGVSVAKNVDEDTRLAVQYINENKGMSEDVISGRVNEIYNEYIAANQNTEGEAEMTPEQLRELTALEYLRKQALINALSDNISKIDAESKNISAKAHEDFIADSQARSERRKALEKERISAQRELIEATKDAAKAMGSIIESGKLALSGFTKEQKDRKLHVNRIANAAVANGKDWSQVEQKAEKKRKAKWLIDSSKNVKDFALGTLNNFNTMLKLVDTNNLMGKGRLYDYFMLDTTGAMAAGQNYRDGMRSAKEELQDAAKRITGKSFSNLFFESTGKAKGVSLEYMDKKGVKRNIKMSYGELLYLYSVGKMADGRIKLERMGIDEAALEKISEKIPQRLRDFMDWVQSDFLPKRREKYNETHKKMFGTSMAKIEGYFPLRYDIKEVKKKEKDIAEEDIERMPSSVTGAIINRVRNGSTLDLSANAFDVLVNNVNEMEEWNAYAQVRRDVNTVCSNQFFENSVEANMKGSYNLFKDAARVAVRSFKDKDLNWIDKVAGNINKSVAVGAIGFRLTTAMKQFLSYPAFMGYSINPAYQARLIQNALPVMWIQNWQWAMKELPGFKDRWDSRNMGDEKLMDEFAKTKFDKFTSEAVNVSLFPNRLIDAITVVAGAKSVYDYQFVKNKKAGMDEAEAKRRALISASVAYNETQQSALDEFLSPTQKSGTALARAVTTFQNAGFSFMRKEVEPVVENYRITVNNKALMEGTMKKYIKDGMSEEEARKQARKDLTKAFVNNLNRQGIFLFALGMIWRYGIPAITGTLGDDDDEKEKDMLVSMAISPVDGTVMIGQFLETESKGYDYSLFIAAKEMEKLRKDFVRAVDEEGLISWDALYATGNIGLRLKGLNLESLSNIYKGFEGMFKDKSVDANDVLTVLNYPKTDKRAYAAKIKEGEGLIEYAGRIRKAYDNDKLFDRYVGQYINKYYFHDADGDMTEFNRVLKKAKQWEKLKKAGDKSDEFTELNKDAEFWKQLLKDVTTLKKGYKEGYEFKAEELKDIKEGIKNREPSYME